MPEQLNPNVQFRTLVQDMSEVVDEAILHAVDSGADDTLLATLAEARGGVVRMNHALKVVTISVTPAHNDTLPQGAQPKALPLPKLQKRPWEKQRPGIKAKLKGSLDFACPTCGAVVGQQCWRFESLGKHKGAVTDVPAQTPHGARQALAKTANDRIRAAYDREMAKGSDHGD